MADYKEHINTEMFFRHITSNNQKIIDDIVSLCYSIEIPDAFVNQDDISYECIEFLCKQLNQKICSVESLKHFNVEIGSEHLNFSLHFQSNRKKDIHIRNIKFLITKTKKKSIKSFFNIKIREISIFKENNTTGFHCGWLFKKNSILLEVRNTKEHFSYLLQFHNDGYYTKMSPEKNKIPDELLKYLNSIDFIFINLKDYMYEFILYLLKNIPFEESYINDFLLNHDSNLDNLLIDNVLFDVYNFKS